VGRHCPVVGALVAALIVLLLGCRASNVASDFVLDERRGTGVAVVSFTQSGLPGRFGMAVELRALDRSYEASIPVVDFFGTPDWPCPFPEAATDDAPCGRLAVLELRAGDYEFYSWQGKARRVPWRTETVGPVKEFSKRFSIVAGKAVYLGGFHFAITYDLSEFPHRGARFPYRLKVTDMRLRDFALLARKNPTIPMESIVANVLAP
jgi:hypothetical protein